MTPCRMLTNVNVENIMRGSQISAPLPLIGSKKGVGETPIPVPGVNETGTPLQGVTKRNPLTGSPKNC